MRHRIAAILDYAAPCLFGARCWLDAILGYKPDWTDEPEAV